MSKPTVRRRAAKLGHRLGRFEARRYKTPGWQFNQIIYHVTWCKDCSAAAFTDDETSPALSRQCNGKVLLEVKS